MNFILTKAEIETEYGKEIVVQKKYKLFKDQWQNRLWVFQPQDKTYLTLKKRMEENGQWA